MREAATPLPCLTILAGLPTAVRSRNAEGRMGTFEDAKLAELRGKHPGWDFWYVHCVVSPDSWCAKPAGKPYGKASHTEYSPEAIDKWVTGQSRQGSRE